MPTLMIVFFAGLLVAGFALLAYCYLSVVRGTRKINIFTFVVIGMFVGLVGGVTVFFPTDHSKGWNPFGWWLLASFITYVAGGILGVLLYGRASNIHNKTSELTDPYFK